MWLLCFENLFLRILSICSLTCWIFVQFYCLKGHGFQWNPHLIAADFKHLGSCSVKTIIVLPSRKEASCYSDSGNVSTSQFCTKHNDLFSHTFSHASKPCEKCDEGDEAGLILDYPIQWANQKTFTLVLYQLSVSYSSIISAFSYAILPPVTLWTMTRSKICVVFI